uniref:Uncharacterized protein n=1 Tax=Anguilla anguilla TaxID=7936 RepID=A0A0E9UDJ9_ANGAN
MPTLLNVICPTCLTIAVSPTNVSNLAWLKN